MARVLPLKWFILLGAAYAAARGIAFAGAGAREFRDTLDYNAVAGAPLRTLRFAAGAHPPTVPFFYKVLGTGDSARLAGQLIFSIVCWLGLATAVAAVLRSRGVRLAAFGAILVFSLSASVVQWDAVLLSESVSISLTAALVGMWITFLARPSPWTVAGVIAVTGAWCLTRDPHAYVLLFAVVVLAASLTVRDGRRLRAVALAGVLIVTAVSLWSADAGYHRWQYPLQNVIALRIAADPGALEAFRDAGMPVTPRFIELSRSYRSGTEDPFLHPFSTRNPERRRDYLPFQLWLADHGRSTYTKFLITHPGYVADAFPDLDHVLLDPDVASYASEDPPRGFGFLPKLLYVPGPVLPLVLLAVALALAALAVARQGPRRTWAVPVFMIAVALPFAVLTWHGEVLEIDRHGLIASIFLRLGTLLLALMAIDRLAGGRPQAPAGTPA